MSKKSNSVVPRNDPKTVGDLRKAIEDLPDDMPIYTSYDGRSRFVRFIGVEERVFRSWLSENFFKGTSYRQEMDPESFPHSLSMSAILGLLIME